MSDSPAKSAWMKANTTTVTLKLNNRTDSDILDRLSAEPSRQGYIKSLIREDLKKKKGEN